MLKNKELKKESHEKWILHFYLTYFLRKRTRTIVRIIICSSRGVIDLNANIHEKKSIEQMNKV